MADKIFFISGDKSFELINISEDSDRWFLLIERSRRFTSRIKIDEDNLRWVCEALIQASYGDGNRCRRWGRKIQVYTCRVFQNFNSYGRFVRIESWLGDRKSAVIIPENDFNRGWADIAEKIQRFLGKASNRRFQLADQHDKSYFEAAKIPQWPTIPVQDDIINQPIQETGNTNLPHLSKCLVGYFSDPFNISPNPEVIQKWFVNRWKVTAGLKVTPMNHNQFLFDLPSRQEANRVKYGDWFWNGRRLSLQWWSPVTGSQIKQKAAEHRWLKVFGIPLHAWSLETFRTVGNQCGGFVGIDDDTRNKTHLFWARICVNNSSNTLPATLDLTVGNWIFEVSILADENTKIRPTRRLASGIVVNSELGTLKHAPSNVPSCSKQVDLKHAPSVVPSSCKQVDSNYAPSDVPSSSKQVEGVVGNSNSTPSVCHPAPVSTAGHSSFVPSGGRQLGFYPTHVKTVLVPYLKNPLSII